VWPGAVYNKEQVYQKREFALLLSFCEEYAARHAHGGQSQEKVGNNEEQDATDSDRVRQTRQRRKRSREPNNATDDAEEFVVEKLVRIRVNKRHGKQVLVLWEGYRRPTWEPYDSIYAQLL
jgi:hypothetical protein